MTIEEINPAIRSTKEQVDELLKQNRMILEFNLHALKLLTTVVSYVNTDRITKGDLNG